MSSSNTGYPYQRPQQHPAIQGQNVQSFSQQQQQQQQGVVNSYGGGRADYVTQQRWPDYAATQHQYAPSPQQISGLAMGNTGVRSTGSRGSDAAVGVSSGGQTTVSRTTTASPVPGRASSGSGFSGGGYDHYIGATIATHVQHYQSQTPTTTTATSNQGSSRTVTAHSRQDPGNTAFSGYNHNQYTIPSHAQNYQQSQPATTTVEMAQQYRTSGNAPQQRQQQQVAEYFDYTPSPTTSTQNYTPLYQTTNSIRQSAQATSAPIYTTMYQTADPTPASHGTSSTQGYDGIYQTAELQQRQQQQQQQQQSIEYQPRTVTSVQQPVKQPPQPLQFQAVNQPRQQQYSTPSTLVQHNQYETFSPPIIRRTPTPSSSTPISETSYSSAMSYQTAPSQPQTQLQTHVAPSQLQTQRQPQAAPPPQALVPQPAPPPSQQPVPTPKPTPVPKPAKQPKPKTKPRAKKAAQQQNNGGLKANSWDVPVPAPPAPKVLQESSMPAIYRQALCNTESEVNATNTMGWSEETPAPRIVDVDMMGASQSVKTWNAPATATPPPPKAEGAFGVTNQQSIPQAQNMQGAPGAQQMPNTSPQPQQVLTAQRQQEWPQPHVQTAQYRPQRQHVVAQPPQQYAPEQLQQQPGLQHQYQPQCEPVPQYPQAQSQPGQPQHQMPTAISSQPAPQEALPAQPQPKHDSQPQSRAPSEPRPAAPPLNKDLMEQQMKVMVERMRYYQAADPVTFQQVWDNVRKSGGAAGGAITNGSAGGASSGAVMTRDGSNGSVSGGGSGERRVIMDVPRGSEQRMAPQAVSGANSTSRSQPQQPVQVQPAQRSAVPAQTVAAPVAVSTVSTPPQTTSVLPPKPTPQENAINLKTARAVSKYLIKTSGHCLPEEVTLDLLNRIKSFPVLCDKLEAMGYQFHRGNFSRFLLAEVDDKEEVAEEVDVDMDTDDGESRVLGEVEDDQEQIMRELNEARDSVPPPPEPAGRVVCPPNPEQPAKRGRGRPRKSVAAANEFQTASEPDTDIPNAPKTPTASTATINSLPTPMSVIPTAPMASSSSSTNQPAPTALFYDGDIQQPPPSPEDVSPSPKPDYTQRQPAVPRHPTPQSVKVTHATPTTHAGEVKQFVAPSQIYRPPTPPRMVIDLESSPPPQPQRIEEVEADVEMLEEEVSPAKQDEADELSLGGSPKSLVVKLRLNSKEPDHSSTEATPPTVSLPFSKGVTIDLTSSATPEPQTNRAPQAPATAPQLRWSSKTEGRGWKNYGVQSPPPAATQPTLVPTPIPVPQSAPAKQSAAPKPVREEPLYRPISKENALLKVWYDPATIARDIMIATGRRPDVIRPLNAHLDALMPKLNQVRVAGVYEDLATVRWDILDPDPVGYSGGDADDSDGGFGGMADDEDEGSGVGGLGFAVARAPVRTGNQTAVKGIVAPSPTPVGRGRARGRGRGSILGASVRDFENSRQGITTASNLNNTSSGGGTLGRQSGTNDGRSNGNANTNPNANGSNSAGSWGGFVAPAPRSNSRTGSGLRNVMTPDVSNHSFQVVIRSPSVSSIDRSRAEPPSVKSLKRQLDDSDKEKETPATKKGNRLAGKRGAASRATRKGKNKAEVEEEDDELRPSGFKVFKCKWRNCLAELHNFETLHRHVIKAHCKISNAGIYPCRWEKCSRPLDPGVQASIDARKGKTFPISLFCDFNTPEEWEKHVMESHLDRIKNQLGVGPSVGPYDREAVGSDVDYLSDSHGRRVTPIARPAPSGYVFLPPPGYVSESDPNRYISRVRALGAGMEGNESADVRDNDDGEGIYVAVRRIVAAEDGLSGAISTGAGRGAGGSAKEKPKKGGGDDEFEAPLGVGAFTVHDEE